MEILVGNDGFNTLKRRIGRRFRAGQHTRGIENIQPLVLHRPHIEMVHSHDHKNIQIVFAAIHFFVPLHGVLEGCHGMLALAYVFWLGKQLQCHFTTAAGGKAIFHKLQVTGDQGEQIGWLGERVLPGHGQATIVAGAAVNFVAVREQNWKVRRRDDGGREYAHHIRAIRVKGNFPEALRFALGAVHPVGQVQALQRRIAFRGNTGLHFQLKLRFIHSQAQAAGLFCVALCRQ